MADADFRDVRIGIVRTESDECPEAPGFGGYAGPSIQDRMSDDLFTFYAKWHDSNFENKYFEGLTKGMAQALARLQNCRLVEILDKIKERYENG